MELVYHPLKANSLFSTGLGRRMILLEREKPLLSFTLKDTGLLPELKTHLFHPFFVVWVFRLLTKVESKVDVAVGVPVVLGAELPPPYKLDTPTSFVK